MAATSTTLSPITATAVVRNPSRTRRSVTPPKVTYIKGFNAYNGLKAHNHITNMGLPVSADYAFAKIVCSLRNKSGGGGGGGGAGAFATQCNAAAEIFRIAAVMNGLTLVGVALGFVLLWIEAAVEEAAESE